MKRLISVFLLVALAVSAYGQGETDFRRSEIDASYGVVTTNQLFNIFKDIVSVVFTFGNYDKTNTDYTGGWFLDYKFAPTRNLLLGVGVGIDGASGDLEDDDVVYGSYTSSYTTVALGFDYRYLNQEWVQLYSGLGTGITFSSDKGTIFDTGVTEKSGNTPYFNFQLNLLGVRVGKSLAGFAELGFGYKGMINAGISYSF